MSDRRHVIVTGGGSGIGLAIARALAATGDKVTIMGRALDRLERASRECGNALLPVACDVGDETAVGNAFADALTRNGPASMLVNAAGIVRTAPFAKTGDDVWNALWRTNVLGAVHACRQVLPGMRSLKSGRIINIASTASLKGYAYVSAYAATKHALLGMTRSLALELANTPITVNAVCPGYTETDIIRDAVGDIIAKTGRSEAEAMATFTGANPQGRLITPEEVAETILWLASDAARSMTGQAIVVAGGEIM
ncbi:SDR family NAD(P)-dependent oxidoreductase [Porphyrobacter algicida]|uniref:SDR family NAD(P)-dependent oxidoreductase n=1 Tax=Qipengyuania algicida TaxID=1836209 RepID=A0A845AGA5_9SPHN|nr:SDR family oxidoreductase [Qipengyuania algicida]MXP29270.1 SDR family NAD(P)-dependent oxidoreductase [Qipengyuania algicida]